MGDKRIAISLTQFIDFTTKGSTAKTNSVRKIKQQPDYDPAKDYWKPLRDRIVKYHEKGQNLDVFEQLIANATEKRKANYTLAVKQYLKFLKGKETLWFSPGKAIWSYEELLVRSSPELGLLINDEPHLIKLYFKGEREKIDKRNISTALTLLNTAEYDKGETHVLNAKRSVLNIQKNSLHMNESVTPDQLLALRSEAQQFAFLWKHV